MTTPEVVHRRQLVEGVVIMLLAIFSVAQGIYFNVKNDDQQACIEHNFTDLSKALDVRGDLATRETLTTRSVLTAFSRAAAQAANAPTTKEAEKQRKQLIDVLVNYQTEIGRIQEIRRDNPVPPYPAGTCKG